MLNQAALSLAAVLSKDKQFKQNICLASELNWASAVVRIFVDKEELDQKAFISAGVDTAMAVTTLLGSGVLSHAQGDEDGTKPTVKK